MALRRPAAVKAAAKNAVRVRGVLRRPARAEEERNPGVRGENLEDRFIAGELVEASKVPLGRLTQGTLLVCEGEYWGAPCKVCGVIRSLKIKGASDVELAVKAEGTDHEDLLKWNSENPEAAIRVHLCGGACPAKIEAKDLIHAQKVRLKTREDEGGWTENMKGSLDELAALRRDKAAPGPEREERERAQKADGKEREKKKKKKKKAKRSRSTSETSQTREKKTPKKKVESQKSLSQVFGTTALDPDPKVRRRLLKRVKRKMRKKKDESSPSSGSSLEGSSKASSLGSSESGQLFEDSHKVRSISRKAPGALTYGMVKEMQRQLLTSAGTVWERDRSAVPPIALQYYRSQLASRLTGGAAREALTLSWALDLALQGKVANLADCLSQRLKSIEMSAGGTSWMVAQRVEVVPPEKGHLSSRAEAQAAAKENKDELKARNLGKGKEKGKSDSAYPAWRPGGKGEQKGKDKGKNKKGSDKEEGKRGS
jgi:hypothetical protein